MEKPLKELLIVLDILIANHRELISCEQKKLEMIIKQDWKGLQLQVDMSTQILQSIDTAERLRLDLIERIGFSKETPIKEVVNAFGDQDKEKIINSREKLVSTLQELKSLNKQIETLIESSLEIINFSLSLFQENGQASKTYSGNGEEKKAGKCTPLVLDTKA